MSLVQWRYLNEKRVVPNGRLSHSPGVFPVKIERELGVTLSTMVEFVSVRVCFCFVLRRLARVSFCFGKGGSYSSV